MLHLQDDKDSSPIATSQPSQCGSQEPSTPANPAPAPIHEVILERVGMSSRGAMYSATYQGEVICTGRDPEFAACRELAKRGIRGKLVTRWKGSPHTAMTMGIAWGATKRTEESSKSIPRTVAWTPYEGADGGAEDLQNAVSASRGSPKTAETTLEVAEEGSEGCGRPGKISRRLAEV